MYFDIETQELKSCGKGFYTFEITHDSIVYESTNFTWNYDKSKEKIPKKINLNNIPNGYDFFNGIEYNLFHLEKNRKYKITFYTYLFLGGREVYIINIWTDSTGRVYKTTHSDCGLESLDMVEYEK